MLICCWNFHIDTELARTFIEIVSTGSFTFELQSVLTSGKPLSALVSVFSSNSSGGRFSFATKAAQF